MLLLTQIKLFLDNYLCIYFHVLYLFFMLIYNISKTKFPCQTTMMELSPKSQRLLGFREFHHRCVTGSYLKYIDPFYANATFLYLLKT